MALIYVDTSHYVAMLIIDDSLHDQAVQVVSSLTTDTFVTSDPVLVELLAFVSSLGEQHRSRAVELVEKLRGDPSTEVVPQSRDLFDKGLELYAKRRDKEYSLTDAMSMVICRERGIRSGLTHDRHFAQEGLATLL